MKKPASNAKRLNEKLTAQDLMKMNTEVALLSSMMRSKTLTLLVLVGMASFFGFLLFLFNYGG
jgi:hypothetical protein